MYISSGLYSIFSLDPDKCTPLYCKIVLKYIITYHQIQMYIVCTYYIRSNRICTTISWFKTLEAMRFNIVFIFLILAFFQTEIQARWSRILPKSKKNQPSEIYSTQKSTSKYVSFLPKQFQDKSIEKIYKGYCQFLLGAQTWVQAQVKSNFASSSCCVFTEFEFFIKLWHFFNFQTILMKLSANADG